MTDVNTKRLPQPPDDSTLAAALFYAKNGFLVFPAPLGTKKSHKSAKISGGRAWGSSGDPDQIKRDWAKWPDANIGLPTGPETGFFVVEADTLDGHNVDGIASLAALQDKFGTFPETAIAMSPSGSTHYYFRYPEGVKIINSASVVAPGVDVRGEGGMVVAPPSVKPERGKYKWIQWAPIAEAPNWLIELCKKARRLKTVETKPIEADIETILKAIDVIRNDDMDWEKWNTTGMAIFAATNGSDEGFKAFDELSGKSDKYNPDDIIERWSNYTAHPPSSVGAATLFWLADRADPTWRGDSEEGVNLTDFVAYMPLHTYIFIPTRDFWAGASVNARIKPVAETNEDGSPVFVEAKDENGKKTGKAKQKYIGATAWLDRHKPIEQMTWAPGEALKIPDRLVSDGGWHIRKGVTCFNLYRPPNILYGDPNDVAPWLDHIYKVYPDDAEHIIQWCAHRVQRPQEKINHALFLGGEQGIGKDTILEPVKRAVGPWNFKEISPKHLAGQFNAYLKSVILRINEAHDLGDVSRYQFYEQMKTLSAAPPDVHMVNEKHLKEYYVSNCCGVVITSNHKTDGIFLPPDDRRTYVAWSELTKEDFDNDYWISIYDWYDAGGDTNVAAYLKDLDISDFKPKSPPHKTEAFWSIANSNVSPEESDIGDILEDMGRPAAVTIAQILDHKGGFGDVIEWLEDRKNARAIPHKMSRCDYTLIRSPDEKRGRWKVSGRQTTIYVRRELSLREQLAAARNLCDGK